ncbi:unnamed protein product [Phytomonas sp. EM1]|nr:unnamed protein product [Phytomonas sp. EM1]|eukprot:CCW60218.1 unnamed protein product [Phytomonas sp. isolate EM1]
MPLTPVAFVPPGCSSQCSRSLVSKSNLFAFASIHSILLYQIDSRVLPNVGDTNPTGSSVPEYRIVSLFGSGSPSEIISYDYNEDFMACLTAQKPCVTVWRLSNGECITDEKIPASLGNLFQRSGKPTTLCVAGKNHLIFGTSTGRLVSLNTSASDKTPAEPRFVVVPTPTPSLKAPTDLYGKPIGNSFDSPNLGVSGSGQREAAESVECVAVSPVRADLVACGTSDGTLCFLTLSATAGLTPTASFFPFSPPNKEKDSLLTPNPLPVSVIAFDVGAVNQLVVGSREGGLALCDISNPKGPTLVFEHKESVSAIAWVPGKAGTFFTVNRGSNLMHKWQVGAKTASTIIPLDASLGIKGIASLDGDHVSLGFTNGTVAVYNLLQRQYEFQTEGGNTQTVLACRCSRHDRDLIASTGVEGEIRVWNTRTMTLQYRIEVSGQVAVHAVDWSPNGKYLVAGLSNGEVVHFTCSTQRQGWRTPVSVGAVCRVLWLPASAESTSLVVCTSSTGVALLSAKNGQVLHRLSAPGGAGIRSSDVEPTKGKTLAMGCADGNIYLFNLLSPNEKPMLTLSGHVEAVRDLAFHPSAASFLLSGGQDATLRVWDLSSSDSHAICVKSRVLRGHGEGVGGVGWCGLAPYLAFSGSDDRTVGLWDIRGEGRSLARVRRHAAGVVAIASHPERPLVCFSASRDGAMVGWWVALLSPVSLRAAVEGVESLGGGDAAALMSSEPTPKGLPVAGYAVQNLTKELAQAANNPVDRSGKLLGFFEFPQGCSDLLQLAAYAKDPSSYVADPKAAILPVAKILDAQKARAKQMHDKARGKTVAALGPAYRQKRLMESAKELLKVGQFEDACNAFMEAEAWDPALAIAPMISREFWRGVCLKATAAMEAAGDARAVMYAILAEESARAAQTLTRLRGGGTVYDEAVAIARSCPQRDSTPSPGEGPHPTGLFTATEPARRGGVDLQGASPASQVVQQQRMGALLRGRNPRILAALHLASGASDEAIRALLHAGEVGLAHALLPLLPLREQATIDAISLAATLRAARGGAWELALLLAARHSNPHHPLATLFALFQDVQGRKTNPTKGGGGETPSEALKAFREQLRVRCEALQLPLDPAVIQQKHANDGLSSQNQIAAMVLQGGDLATAPHILQSICGFLENLLEVALRDINGADANFYLKQAFNVTGYVAIPPNRAGEVTTQGADHRRFLALAFLLASLMGVKVYRFPRLLNPAFARAREFAKGNTTLEGLVGKVQPVLANYSPHSSAVECLAPCAELPAVGLDGKLLMSSLTSLPVYGAAYPLEDGVSVISKGEALEWGLCCHFSLLGSGARMLVM